MEAIYIPSKIHRGTLNNRSTCLNYFKLQSTSNISQGYTDILQKPCKTMLALLISWQPSLAWSYHWKQLAWCTCSSWAPDCKCPHCHQAWLVLTRMSCQKAMSALWMWSLELQVCSPFHTVDTHAWRSSWCEHIPHYWASWRTWGEVSSWELIRRRVGWGIQYMLPICCSG